MTKDIINMRAVINSLAPSLGEEGTNFFENKRQMFLMKKENIKLFNEKI